MEGSAKVRLKTKKAWRSETKRDMEECDEKQRTRIRTVGDVHWKEKYVKCEMEKKKTEYKTEELKEIAEHMLENHQKAIMIYPNGSTGERQQKRGEWAGAVMYEGGGG